MEKIESRGEHLNITIDDQTKMEAIVKEADVLRYKTISVYKFITNQAISILRSWVGFWFCIQFKAPFKYLMEVLGLF